MKNGSSSYKSSFFVLNKSLCLRFCYNLQYLRTTHNVFRKVEPQCSRNWKLRKINPLFKSARLTSPTILRLTTYFYINYHIVPTQQKIETLNVHKGSPVNIYFNSELISNLVAIVMYIIETDSCFSRVKDGLHFSFLKIVCTFSWQHLNI